MGLAQIKKYVGPLISLSIIKFLNVCYCNIL